MENQHTAGISAGYVQELQSMLEALNHERRYYMAALEEAKAVIAQLVSGVPEGQPELIHPYDMMDIINKTDIRYLDFKSLSQNTDVVTHSDNEGRQKVYKQSVYMPLQSTMRKPA